MNKKIFEKKSLKIKFSVVKILKKVKRNFIGYVYPKKPNFAKSGKIRNGGEFKDTGKDDIFILH